LAVVAATPEGLEELAVPPLPEEELEPQAATAIVSTTLVAANAALDRRLDIG